VQHPHNLLKMRLAEQDSQEGFPSKCFRKFWKGGHRSHSSSSEKGGKEQRIACKLAKIFGG
jgi:hypothetical protein